MDHRRQALVRVAEISEQPDYAVERKIDQLRVEPQQPREYRLDAQGRAP
ncbi:MAG TPA: hypothetical protein VGU20_27100 [Stellaceae bacterium]|nr:hypothetical protein [Stellaceae bacterium]